MFSWKKDYLDVVLVPFGLLFMFGYHLYLLYKYLRCPETTVLGYENHNKKAWVEKMIQVDIKDRGPAVNVISSNLSASTALSSICLVLSSIIGAWIGSPNVSNIFTNRYIYGSISSSMIYIKYICLLSCFLAAFACFVQAARYFVHANFLISMPDKDVPVGCIVREVIRGSYFWQIGMRSLYFATTLLLWIFGPIPMFTGSVIMVGLLFNFDSNRIPLHHYKPEFTLDDYMQIEAKERGQALAVIGSNTSAASSLASVSLALSSLIGAWMGILHQNEFLSGRIYGNRSPTLFYIKYIAILSCFLVAFACFVQATRCLVQASFLITMPNCEVPRGNVDRAIISGSNFWTVGLRALYFATSLLLWIFGPIPMFVWSLIMVAVLQYLDKNTDPLPLPQCNQLASYESYDPKKIDKDMTAMNETEETNGGTDRSLERKSSK